MGGVTGSDFRCRDAGAEFRSSGYGFGDGGTSLLRSLLRGSWDLVTRVIGKVTILITPIRVLITLLTKSHDHPSRV